jgi:NTP pyrophosphatase (non-canonical NTP hydrolase)
MGDTAGASWDDSPLDAYARWAAGIAAQVGGSDRERLAYLGLGLASEAGELADHLKRLIRDGAADPAGFAEELGDILFYWAALCHAAGRSPEDLLAESRAKIEARLTGGAA